MEFFLAKQIQSVKESTWGRLSRLSVVGLRDGGGQMARNSDSLYELRVAPG